MRLALSFSKDYSTYLNMYTFSRAFRGWNAVKKSLIRCFSLLLLLWGLSNGHSLIAQSQADKPQLRPLKNHKLHPKHYKVKTEAEKKAYHLDQHKKAQILRKRVPKGKRSIRRSKSVSPRRTPVHLCRTSRRLPHKHSAEKPEEKEKTQTP